MDHIFNFIPLMFKPELVEELKKLVTLDPSSLLKEALGIPPHVEHSLKLQAMLEIATLCLEMLKSQVAEIKKVSNVF